MCATKTVMKNCFIRKSYHVQIDVLLVFPRCWVLLVPKMSVEDVEVPMVEPFLSRCVVVDVPKISVEVVDVPVERP